MRLIALVLSMISLVGCSPGDSFGADETVLEIGFFGGCAMVGDCPRYIARANGQVEAQLVMLTGVKTTATADVEASLVGAALDEFVARDLDSVAERFAIGCRSPVDGVDVYLALPTEGASMACINLTGIADEMPAFGELVEAIVKALGGKAGLLGRGHRAG